MGAFGGLQRVSDKPYAGVEMAWKTLPLLLQVEALIRLQFEGPSGSNARRAFACCDSRQTRAVSMAPAPEALASFWIEPGGSSIYHWRDG